MILQTLVAQDFLAAALGLQPSLVIISGIIIFLGFCLCVRANSHSNNGTGLWVSGVLLIAIGGLTIYGVYLVSH